MALISFSRLRSVSFRRFSVLPTALLTIATLVIAACHPSVSDPKDPKFVVAEKDTWQITRGDLDQKMGQFLAANHATPEQVGPAKMNQLQSALLDSMVLEKLILAKAATLNLPDVDADVAKALDMIKQRIPPGQDLDSELKKAGMTQDQLVQTIHDKIVIQKVVQSEALKNVQPTDQEINDFYMKNQDRLAVPAMTRASRILILLTDKTTPADKTAKKKAIDKARARIVKGEDFSVVAQQVSEDQSSKLKGGDIGWFRVGENEDPKFDQVVAQTKVGELSPVFETPLGYQFLKVTDRHTNSVLSVADARPYIEKALLQQKQEAAVKAYTDNLLATSGVTYHVPKADPLAPTGDAAAPVAK